MKEEILKEFDDIYIHNNLWKSDDESEAYIAVDNIRQFIFEKLEVAYQKGLEDGKKK